MNNRSKGQIASLNEAYKWHMEMATLLEFKGRFDEAAIHLRRAHLVLPALKQAKQPLDDPSSR
jgi:hypothetical protein